MFLYKRTISTREYTFVNGLIIFKIDRIISNYLRIAAIFTIIHLVLTIKILWYTLKVKFIIFLEW